MTSVCDRTTDHPRTRVWRYSNRYYIMESSRRPGGVGGQSLSGVARSFLALLRFSSVQCTSSRCRREAAATAVRAPPFRTDKNDCRLPGYGAADQLKLLSVTSPHFCHLGRGHVS